MTHIEEIVLHRDPLSFTAFAAGSLAPREFTPRVRAANRFHGPMTSTACFWNGWTAGENQIKWMK